MTPLMWEGIIKVHGAIDSKINRATTRIKDTLTGRISFEHFHCVIVAITEHALIDMVTSAFGID